MSRHHHIKTLSVVSVVGWILMFGCFAYAGWDSNPLLATNGMVNAVAVDGSGNVYIGGIFTSVGSGTPANNIAKWNGTSWQALGGGLNGTVSAIAVDGINVYAAGTFTNKVGWWNGTSWQYLLIIGSPDSPISGTVYALAVDGNNGRLYAGGNITNPPSRIIEWSGGNWGPVSGIPNDGCYVSALAISGSVLYAGRSSISSGDYIYQLSGTTMVPLTSSINSDVTAMTYAGGKLYVGGSFTLPGNYIAVWNGSSWSSLGSGVGSAVTAIAVDTTDNIVYAGESSGGYITAWNAPAAPNAWSAVSGVNSPINGLAYYNSRVYAGGTFTAPTSYFGMYSINLPPRAIKNSYTTNEDTLISGNVLTDSDPDGVDTDPEGTTLTAVIVTGPPTAATESFTLNPNGSFTYTPKLNYYGIVSFTYKAVDATSKESPPATVTITVTAVNDDPVVNNDSSYSASEDTLLSVSAASGVLANDTDVDSTSLTATLNSGPSHAASFALNTDGSFTYKASVNYNGTDSFTYYAKDNYTPTNGISALPATVTITVGAVNDPPVANPDSYSVNEDTPLVVAAANGVLKTDSDIESASLTAQLAGNPAHGTVSLAPDGSFTYTPSANYYGTDTFTYYAKDNYNAMSNTTTVSITMNPINDAPVANPDIYLIAQNTILTIPTPGVLANDRDVENNPLTPTIVTNASNGTAILNSDGSFTYTPTSNYFGPDSFSYKINDGNLDSAPVSVSIQVDVPVPSMLSVSAITATTVLLTGNSNTQTATERGFFWWTDYDSSGLMSSGSAGMGNFSMKPTSLKPNTTYNVSAYIKVGTQVITSANKLTFTTTDPLPPSVITGSLFSVIGQDITATGEITNTGSTPVTIYGFVYNTSPYPTVWNKALPFTWDTSLPLSAGKVFSGTIKNLPAGKYYLRAYANNSFGTTYGEQIEFDIVDDVVSSSIPGDVNGYGGVDLEDAIIVLQILSGISVNTQIHLEADVNGDKRIGIEELAYILQKTAALR